MLLLLSTIVCSPFLFPASIPKLYTSILTVEMYAPPPLSTESMTIEARLWPGGIPSFIKPPFQVNAINPADIQVLAKG